MLLLKRLAMSLCLAVTVLSFPIVSQAQDLTTFTATVNYVGQVSLNGGSYVVIVLTPAGSSTPTNYAVPTSGSNAMMAIALTAMSASKTVTAQVSGESLFVLYMNAT